MEEPDVSAHEGENGPRTDGPLARIRLWTRATSSQSQNSVNVDEAPTTSRIVDLSSIGARTRSPPTSATSNNRNATRQFNRANQSNGRPVRAIVQLSDRLERARQLAAKHGIDPGEAEWAGAAKEQVLRVERPIRMRIRYWCHHCRTQYTNTRVCSQCAHQRCNRCERQPPRRSTPRLRLAETTRTNYLLSPENLYVSSLSEHVISQPSSIAFVPQTYTNSSREFDRRTEAARSLRRESSTSPNRLENLPGRVSKRFRMRVHYTCHECQTSISPKERNCSACRHERCKDCPRNPPRKEHALPGLNNRALERVSMPLGSESDGDDEDENDKKASRPETPRSGVRSASTADTVRLPPPPSTTIEDISTRDTAAEPPEPPPPT